MAILLKQATNRHPTTLPALHPIAFAVGLRGTVCSRYADKPGRGGGAQRVRFSEVGARGQLSPLAYEVRCDAGTTKPWFYRVPLWQSCLFTSCIDECQTACKDEDRPLNLIELKADGRTCAFFLEYNLF